MKFGSNKRAMESTLKQDWKKGFRRSSALLCGTLFLTSMQSAMAAPNDRPSLREFRDQHSNLGSRDARHLFKDTFDSRSTLGASLPTTHNNPGKPTTHSPNWRLNPPSNAAQFLKNGHDAKLFRTGLQEIGSNVVRLNSGVDLDLTSADQNIVLGGNLFKTVGSVEITVGSGKQTFSAGSKVTASEYIAIKQALSGTGQKLIVDQSGIASGGTVDLTEITANNDPMRAANFTVASGVTTYGDFGKNSDFTLKGDLNNYGSIYAVSSRNAVRGGVIRADDITNQNGATISSVLQNSAHSAGLASKVDLELNANGQLSNYGTISSSGNLTLVAGSSIDNTGSVSAHDSVNLNASTINNSNTVTATAGNINIDGSATHALNVNNSQGTLSALHGAINVRTPLYNGTFDNNISGGDLLSKEVNLYAGQGTNNVAVNQLTGTLSQTGLAGHILASTDNLKIGNTCLTGDPTFYNLGDISITGNVDVNEALTIIATGNISSFNGTSISARGTNSGFNLTMIAGANITNPVTGGDSTLPTGTPTAVTLDGTASATGGSITLGTSIVNTSPTSSGSGGNIALFAFKGASVSRGRVDVDSASFTTSGMGAGANGNIVIVAGAVDKIGTLGTAVQIGAVNTTGGTGGGGDLTVTTAEPQSSGGAIVYNSDGTLAAGPQLIASSTLTAAATIGFGNGKSVVGGNVSLTAGQDIIQQTSSDTLVTDNINANVVLTANGNIGAGFFNPFIIEGFNQLFTKKVLKNFSPGNSVLTANGGGQVDIVRNASTNLSLLQSSGVDGFSILTNSKLSVDGNVSSTNGAVHLQNTGGNSSIASGVQVTALNAIDMTNATSKKLKPTLVVNTNAQLTTTAAGTPGSGGFANIALTLDPKAFSVNSVLGLTGAGTRRVIPPPTYALTPHDYISPFLTQNTTGLGTITFFGKSPVALGPPINVFTANNAAIDITNGVKKGAIVFSGGVNIQAGQ